MTKRVAGVGIDHPLFDRVCGAFDPIEVSSELPAESSFAGASGSHNGRTARTSHISRQRTSMLEICRGLAQLPTMPHPTSSPRILHRQFLEHCLEIGSIACGTMPRPFSETFILRILVIDKVTASVHEEIIVEEQHLARLLQKIRSLSKVAL